MQKCTQKIIFFRITKNKVLKSSKIDKYEYLTAGKEILLFNQSQMIEQAKFTYSPLGKALEKQTKKQVDALKSLKISNKTDELKKFKVYFRKISSMI